MNFLERPSWQLAISSGVLVCLATGLTALLIIESFSGGMGNYDACFDALCD